MVSIPEGAFVYGIRGRTLVPRFLGQGDHPWLLALLDEHDRSVGTTRGSLEARLKEIDLPGAPPGCRKMASAVLLALTEDEVKGALRPSVVRAALFGAAARGGPREEVLRAAAAELGIGADALFSQLFADLPPQRIVKGTRVALTPLDLAQRTNLAFAQSLLFRASAVDLRIRGRAHAVVRQAKLGGLICEVTAGDGEQAQLRISGPFTLFHHTLLYGRALSRLLPLLAWTEHFELSAEIVLGNRVLEFQLKTPAPIFPSEEPRRFDSKVEARFARAFARIAPGWVLTREPGVIQAGQSLIFPDFAAHRRGDPRAPVWIEIVGYWTPSYLARKLAALRSARLDRLLLCVDESLACEEAAFPAHAKVIRYRRKVDPAQVLAALEALPGSIPIADRTQPR